MLSTLEHSIREVRTRCDSVRSNLDKLDDFIDDVIQQRGHALVELAQHYLPDLSGSTVSQQFIEVRSQLQQLLKEKQRREVELQSSWDANLDRRSQLESEVETLTDRLNDLAAQRDELQLQLANRLKDHEDFQQLSEQALTAENLLKRNELRVAEMRDEVAEKLPAYEKSRLFQYLFRRGYGTSKYKLRGLTKQLDGWVAKLAKYNKNRQSYDFLRVTPELMAAEVERRQAEFTKLMERIEAIEDSISDEIGLTEVLRQGTELGEQRERLLSDTATLEDERRKIEAEMESLQEKHNEYYVAGINRLKEFLGSMEESALAKRTRATPQPADDAIFKEIRHCNQQLREARTQTQEDRQQLEYWQSKLSGIDQVVRQFHSSEFDSRRSFFSRRLNTEQAVNRFLQGSSSAQQLWSEIRQNQQFVRPEFDNGWGGMEGVFDSDVSHVLGRVLIEIAGEAMRQSARRGMHRRGPVRQRSRHTGGRPTYRRNGGFTSGRGF